MQDKTVCCSGARLTGNILSGRGRGGRVWTIDLLHVSEATYSEYHGLTRTRYALRLRTRDGWHEVTVELERRRMAASRDLIEHRALCAAVAERLADLRPGFRMGYQVFYAASQVLLAVVLGLPLAILAVVLGAFHLNAISGGAAIWGAVAVAGIVLAAVVLRRASQRRWPDVSAAALPGILTASGRRG